MSEDYTMEFTKEDEQLERIEKLEKEIEEMKCCANCEYYSMEYLPFFCIKRQTATHCTGLCDKWEIRK